MRLAYSLLCAALCLASSAAAQPDVALAADFNQNGGFSRACLNDGSGTFTCDLIATSADRWKAQGADAADLDGDGDLDVIFAVAEGAGLSAANRLCTNDGTGAFSCADLGSELGDSRDVAAADLDGDGDRDLAFANRGTGQVNRVCLGDGMGAFSCSDVSPDANQSFAVTSLDANGDTNADLVFANTDSPTRLCLGDGSGAFSCSNLSGDVTDATDVTPADLDGDGDRDLVITSFAARARACFNDGAGAFSCGDVSADGGDTYASDAADLDGDGDLDLAFANPISNNTSRTNRVCFNDGSGVFSCSEVSADTDHSRDVAARDFDGDGDTDLFFANEQFFSPVGGTGTGQEQLCLNDGTGTFSCSYIDGSRDDTIALAVGTFVGTPVANEPAEPTDAGLALAAAPNPARGAVTLTLHLPETIQARVEVVDPLGRRVAPVWDGPLAVGTHALPFDASRLPSGLYVVRATTERGVVSEAVTVVR